MVSVIIDLKSNKIETDFFDPDQVECLIVNKILWILGFRIEKTA